MACAVAAVGVPVTTPVVVLSTKPAGSAGDTLNVRVPVTVDAVNAVVAVIAVPTVADTVCVAGDIAGTAAMVTRMVALAKLLPSDAVTT